MALTPTDNEAFLREVDDNLRRDQMAVLARRWGRVALIAIGVGLLALALFLWWRSHRAAQAGVEGETLTKVLEDVQAGKAVPTDPRLAGIADSPRDGYRALGRITQAGLLAQTSLPQGVAAFQRIADDSSLPQPVRDLALIRATTLDLDKLPPQQVIDRMKPLAVPGNAWFGSAGELTAISYLKLGKRNLAGPLFAAIARDATVPGQIRARASGIATSLGQSVDPIASPATRK